MSSSTGVEVAARCRRCGATTPDPRAFRRRAWPGTGSVCPTCASQVARRSTGALLGAAAICLPVGVIGGALGGASPLWQAVALWGGFFWLAMAQAVPHEAGHAVAAHLLGFRVHRVQLGDGRQVASAQLGDTVLELHALPVGGVTWTSTDDPRRYRLRRTVIVAAGPAVTAVIAVGAWQWTPAPGSTADAMRSLVLATSALVLVTNLVPWRAARLGGPVPTDGWQLLATPRLSDAEVREQVALHAHLAVVEQGRRGAWDAAVAGARAVAEADGASLDGQRLLLYALVGAERWAEAAMVARGALARLDGGWADPSASTPPRARAGAAASAPPGASATDVGVLWNDLAACDVLDGDPALLGEADEASARAMVCVGWMPAVVATRGAVLVAIGRHDEGVALLEVATPRLVHRVDRARARCFLAIGEAGRGALDVARRHLAAAERAGAADDLLPRARAAVADAALGVAT